MNQFITVIKLNVPDEIREQLISAKMTCYSHSTDSDNLLHTGMSRIKMNGGWRPRP